MPSDRSLLLDGYRLVDVRCEKVSITSAGEVTIIPAQGAGKTVVILGYTLDDDAAGDVEFRFKDSEGESLSGLFLLKTGGSLVAWPDSPILVTGENRGFNIVADAELAGHIKYAVYEKIS